MADEQMEDAQHPLSLGNSESRQRRQPMSPAGLADSEHRGRTLAGRGATGLSLRRVGTRRGAAPSEGSLEVSDKTEPAASV